MTPDSDVKDRIENPGQAIVLDAGYSSFYLSPADEPDGEEESEGDDEGSASFALDTPEPAVPAMTGPELPGGKAKGRLRKKGKRTKSPNAIDFAKIVGEVTGMDGISTALAVEVDAGLFSTAAADLISNEFIDQQTGLMNILFAPGERPWEDETLPAAERMALMKVIRTNFPDAQKRAEREEFEYRIRARSWGRSANVAPVVAAVTKVEQPAPVIVTKRRESQKAQAEIIDIADIRRDIRLEVPSKPYIREYGQEEIHKLDRNLNAALGMGSIIGMPSSLAMLNMRPKQENRIPVHYLGLAELAASEIQGRGAAPEPEAKKSWNPLIRSRDNVFVTALNRIYSSIVPEILMSITPYRKSVWEDKLLQQKENLADIIRVVPKLSAPAPSPFADREVKMNISVPTFG